MKYKDLTSEQTRQSVDGEQVYTVWRDADREFRARYAGSMHWKTIGPDSREYLYREVKRAKHSLGPRSAETEKAFLAFTTGRKAVKEILRGTTDRMNTMAPVNKALQLNRVPTIAARILRRLDEVGFLGKPLRVTGTHVLYAMERACAVQIGSDLLATGDVDLLWDGRAGLKLTGGPDVRADGVLGLLRQLDKSFRLASAGSFRAVNKDGYMVDLIAPLAKDPILSKPRRIGATADDLTAVEIGGLVWLVNSPPFEQVVVGEDGYPLRMITPDLRAWAIHKLWLSGREDRDPGKKARDRAQGELAIDLLRSRRPDLRFDTAELQALPLALRARITAPLAPPAASDDDQDNLGLRPNW